MRIAGTIVCVVGLTAISLAAAASTPNVLVILADDMGYSDLGCYGGEIATPNLDALAAGGIRYTQFYNTARCWPTRAALLTGYYAQQVGFDMLPGVAGRKPRQRPAWARLLPDYLRPFGYRSYHSGKWHLDGSPVRCGFDRSYALLDFDRNFGPQHHTLDDQPLPPVQRDSGYYSTVAIADYAIEFLHEHAERHPDQPFFQYLAFTVPHFPLQSLPEDIARYEDKYRVGWDAIRRSRSQRIKQMLRLPGKLSALEPEVGPPYKFARARQQLGSAEVWREISWDQLTAEQQDFQAAKMAIHAAMVECMDREIGRVIAQLRKTNAYENTLVLFLSDNGASAEIMIRGDGHDPTAPLGASGTYLCLGPGWSSAANTPFRRHKTWVHEGGIATPLIVHWPAGIAAAGELRHAIGHVIDLAPTILRLAGGSWPTEFDGTSVPDTPGRDLAETFDRDTELDRDSLWWLHEGNRAIRRGKWKLVAARDQQWELYDLARDRSETSDLAAKYPEKVKELASDWQARLREFQEIARAGTDER